MSIFDLGTLKVDDMELIEKQYEFYGRNFKYLAYADNLLEGCYALLFCLKTIPENAYTTLTFKRNGVNFTIHPHKTYKLEIKADMADSSLSIPGKTVKETLLNFINHVELCFLS